MSGTLRPILDPGILRDSVRVSLNYSTDLSEKRLWLMRQDSGTVSSHNFHDYASKTVANVPPRRVFHRLVHHARLLASYFRE